MDERSTESRTEYNTDGMVDISTANFRFTLR